MTHTDRCRRGALFGGTLLALCLAAAGCSDRDTADAQKPGPRVLVLGLDGMDHAITSRMLAEGKLPNLARLRQKGGFSPLETSVPPQSPTAWSNFITGKRPGEHGVFDFIQRNPKTLTPYLSTSKVEEGRNIKIGCTNIPLGGGQAVLLRQEKPFWWYLGEAGQSATVIKMPAHFPPRDDGKARVLTDMGTPDLLGTYGTFTVLTSDAAEAKKALSGGRAVLLKPAQDGSYRAEFEGPGDPLNACGQALSLPVEVRVDAKAGGALVALGSSRTVLARGEWSEFLPLRFEVAGGLSGVSGAVRVYLKELAPTLRIYVSPINIDPHEPALPISSPPEFAGELARKVGRYYTQGMPEDTKALAAGVLSPDEFLQQAHLVLKQRRKMFRAALDEFKAGFLFFYFGSSDQITHMFFRAQDRDHPARTAADEPFAGIIAGVYAELDKEVGLAMERLGPDDLLLVISDHGFGPASYLFDLNAWLVEQGYLVLRETPRAGDSLGHIDWERTQAYGLGLNGLYLNLKGREKYGVVPAERADQLLDKITADLEGIYHPETGLQVVSEVGRPRQLYPGEEVDRAPDLIVGYNRGFKVSDLAAIGGAGNRLFSVNRGAWSGDHCGDHRLVPGVLFSSTPLSQTTHRLYDMAPTVFDFLGLSAPKGWVGRSVLAGSVKK